jgi:uncharacterized membrane protein
VGELWLVMSTVGTPVSKACGTQPSVSAPRFDSVDLLRGIIIVIMSLDHLREYLTYLTFPPEALSLTWPGLFFTRWITHFCAPLFFFLAGTGSYLSQSRGNAGGSLSRFLWTRGLWLMVLEITIIDFAWAFRPFAVASVIWTLGLSMIVMAAVVRLPLRWVAVFGVGMIFVHNLLDPIQADALGRFGWLWKFTHAPGFIPILPQRGILIVLYVLIPWVGVMAAGFGFGVLLQFPAERRRKLMFAIGSVAVALFVVLRATNIYGNPTNTPFPGGGNFVPQHSAMMSLVAFLNVEKYPPSLQFLLMTLGPGILALAAFDGVVAARNRIARVLIVFGRVPLFYYVVHIYCAHLVALAIAVAFDQPTKRLLDGSYFVSPPEPGYGHHLLFIYFVWIVFNVALYFPCRWYAEYKRTHRHWWLSYV